MDRFDWIELEQVPASPLAPPVHELKLTDSGSHFRAAERMFAAGHFRAATELYRRTVGLDMRHFDAWTYLIDTLVRARHLEEADQVSADVLDRFRQVRVLYAARALVLAHQGTLDEAWALSKVSLEGSTKHWYAYCLRGELTLLSETRNAGDAVASYESAARYSPQGWRPLFLGGWALLEAKKAVWAAGLLAEAARRQPHAPVCWISLGDAFHTLRLYEHAEFYYHCAAELDGNSPLVAPRLKRTVPLMYGLLRVFRREDIRRRWKAEFEKLIERPPDVDELY